MKWVRAVTVTGAGLALAAVAACGSQGDAVSGAAVANGVEAAAQGEGYGEAAAENQKEAAGLVTKKLAAKTTGDLGQIVVDGDGRAVYRFDNDIKDPTKSNCAGDCAKAWPPLLASSAANVEVEGIDKALLGVVARDDGSMQVTIGGWPAYAYAQDQPGEVKGQGASGKWFAFTPAGKKAASANGPAAVTLVVMKVGNLGQILTDAAGMTMYRFDRDTKGEKSACNGECAAQWPPVVVPDGAQFKLTGVDQANVGTIIRLDGRKQLTVGGWPMYLFAGDKAPCDINGHGLNGVWFAATATGGKAKAA